MEWLGMCVAPVWGMVGMVGIVGTVRMAEWRNGRMVKWQNGGMAEWQNSYRIAEWQNNGGNGKNGGNGGYHPFIPPPTPPGGATYVLFMVHTDTNDANTLTFYSI